MKRVKLRLVAINGPEFAKEKDCSASCVHGKPPRRLQTDFPYQVLVTRGHPTVWQNKVTLQVRCLAMLQQWLQSGQPKVRRSKQQSTEKTILAAQPVQPMAHTRPVTCCQTEFKYGGNPKREKPAAKGESGTTSPGGGRPNTLRHTTVPKRGCHLSLCGAV